MFKQKGNRYVVRLCVKDREALWVGKDRKGFSTHEEAEKSMREAVEKNHLTFGYPEFYQIEEWKIYAKN